MTNLEKLAITQAQTWHEIVRLKKEINDGHLNVSSTRHSVERITQLEEELYDLRTEVFKELATRDTLPSSENN